MNTGLPPLRRIVLAAALLGAAAPAVAQSPSRDKLVAETRPRIHALDEEFGQTIHAAQQKSDAANCRVSCPPGVAQRIDDEMMTAIKRITASIHLEVDSFIRRMVDANSGRLDIGRLQTGLREVLPSSDEPRLIYEGHSSTGRYLIAAYAIHKGEAMGPGATSVTLRAYTGEGRNVRLADVTGGNMDGYARTTVQEVHPWVSNPVAPGSGETYLLLSGYMTGANGPNNRMRLYAYDGKRFRPIWMPEDVWGNSAA